MSSHQPETEFTTRTLLAPDGAQNDVAQNESGDLQHVIWAALGGDPGLLDERLRTNGPDTVLPSIFDVTGLAAATVAAATLAAAELFGARTQAPVRSVTVDRHSASAAFLSEALFTPVGWERPAVWDPIAGDYEASDGWIRLHTNYRSHRDAVERLVGTSGDKAAVAESVRTWAADDLETAVVEGGGCAAAMHDRAAWLASAPGSAAAGEPLVWTETRASDGHRRSSPGGTVERPFSGVRVLDLTRVIAGPVCTRFLAAYGADVLRIDPRGFEEVAALLPETSTGKHCTMLDLTDASDRSTFDALLAGADVVVSGLRSDALAALGLDGASLRAINPSVVTASLDAYGWNGPWRHRRGFDSLVQMSCGIAAAGAAAIGRSAPFPLPAQALDHGTGYLLAAAVGRAMTRLHTEGVASDVRCSLAATANLLMAHPTPQGLAAGPPSFAASDTVETSTAWGPARRVPVPGSIEGVANDWTIDAGPFGRHEPVWSTC